MDKRTDSAQLKSESNTLFATALGVAAIGALGAAAGALCPVCVVATPALLGFGVYKRWKAATPSNPAPSDENNHDT